MDRTFATTTHHVHDIHIADRARVHFGDHIGDQHFAGGLTVIAKVAPLTDYTGNYAHNALASVSAYVDRQDLRKKLEEQLHNHITAEEKKPRIVVVHGLGGAGKTQLVLDYVQRHRRDYSAVFWIEATNPGTVERDYIQIYMLLHNIHYDAGQDAIQLQYAVPAVKRWFYGRGKRWMFVFDNADIISDPNSSSYVDLRRFLPDDYSAHVIITSRDRSAANFSELPAVEVDKMEPNEALSLFQKQSRIHSATSQQEEQVRAIVKELGFLALAITLAGSYVAATPRLRNDLAGYLLEYRERRKTILTQRPTWLVHQYGESVLTTWETTYEAIEGQSYKACRLLTLLSFFHHDDIPTQFPTDLVDGRMPAWIIALFPEKHINMYDLEEMLRVLVGFSLIKYHDDQKSYSMHGLVQAWAYHRLQDDQQQEYSLIAATLCQSITRNAEIMPPAVRARPVPHVVSVCQHVIHYIDATCIKYGFVSELVHDLADFLGACGYFKDQTTIQRSILRECQTWLGPDHPDTLVAMTQLAKALTKTGELQEALSVQRAALAKQGEILSEDHPHLLDSMVSMGHLLANAGEQRKALSIQRSLLAKHQRILGEDHPDTLVVMNDLATTLGEIGELQESLLLRQSVLAKDQRILGEDHFCTLVAMNNLAATLRKIGEPQGSLSIQRIVLIKQQQILGDDHPYMLNMMNNLAMILRDVGDFTEALSIQRAVLDKSQRMLGEDHPEFAIRMSNLAGTLRDAGEMQEALLMGRAAVAKCKQTLGEGHPDTLISITNLAGTLFNNGELTEALSLQREAATKATEVLGFNHPSTVSFWENLLYIVEKKFQK